MVYHRMNTSVPHNANEIVKNETAKDYVSHEQFIHGGKTRINLQWIRDFGFTYTNHKNHSCPPNKQLTKGWYRK